MSIELKGQANLAAENIGAQAVEKRLREVATSGGFTQFRRTSKTPFNLILEATP